METRLKKYRVFICPHCNNQVIIVHEHHSPPKRLGGRVTTIACPTCHRKLEQGEWEELELDLLLNDSNRYRLMPRSWKLLNPAPHSCRNCAYDKSSATLLLCERASRVRSYLSLYYPNDCEYFTNSLGYVNVK